MLGHVRIKHPDVEIDEEGKVVSSPPTTAAKGKPQQVDRVEALIKGLHLPRLQDGQTRIFDAGVEYGVRSILVGVRVAQELSAMGVQQAVPIIKMAQEMRESEGQAAKIIAAELAEATIEGNKDLRATIQQFGQQMTMASPNPFASMMAGLMQPVLSQTMGRMMKGFDKGRPGQVMDETPPSGSQEAGKEGEEQSPGIEEHSIAEWED